MPNPNPQTLKISSLFRFCFWQCILHRSSTVFFPSRGQKGSTYDGRREKNAFLRLVEVFFLLHFCEWLFSDILDFDSIRFLPEKNESDSKENFLLQLSEQGFNLGVLKQHREDIGLNGLLSKRY